MWVSFTGRWGRAGQTDTQSHCSAQSPSSGCLGLLWLRYVQSPGAVKDFLLFFKRILFILLGNKRKLEESYGWEWEAVEVSCSSHWEWAVNELCCETKNRTTIPPKNIELSEAESRNSCISNENNKYLWSHEPKNPTWISSNKTFLL